jgi:PKD domain/FG-GAP-like repeat
MRTSTCLVGIALSVSWSAGCSPADEGEIEQAAIGSNADLNPIITFTQVGKSVGIDRSTEPPSAGTFSANGTLAYGGWLADFDNDSRLDYYAVNHGQSPHLSGLFINNGNGGFGKNLFTVSLQPSQASFPNFGLSNEMRFVGDLTGDGRVDLFFLCWSGQGVMCVNQGVAPHSDWTGPGYLCFGTADGLAFADVNGDGRIDVLSTDLNNFDTYAAYYSQTANYFWRLNNGNANIQTWPTTTNFLSLRVTDPTSPAAPFVDLNNDGIPDKIVGIPLAANNRGPNATNVGGQQVFLGQANGTYVQRTGTGLDAVSQPITRIEDINDDGCLDIGTDPSGYRDNQNWFIHNKTGSTCNVTFTATARTALPYYPGFKRYNVDVDNSGVLTKAVLIHRAYGNNDGRNAGVTLFRKQPNGTFTALGAAQSGLNIVGTGNIEFYADNLTPGDWNDDGRIDFAGTGNSSIAGSDAGFALWSSTVTTTNSWIKVTLPTVTGFFAGAATIEVFDAGFVGDNTRLVTPPTVLYTGKAWATQVYHFGIGTRSSVDVRVTFPDGRQTIRSGVTPTSRINVQPVAGTPPTAVAGANPTSVAIGQTVTFSSTGSTDPDGTITSFAWDFGDGSSATTATATHAYATAGTFQAKLTVTDNSGATGTASVTITVADNTAPTVSISGAVFTPTVADNIGVTEVEWYFDGALVSTTTTPPFGFTLNLTPVAGSHTLVARAFDAAGNTTDSAAVTLQK